jgi:hypothetical protein
VPELLDQFHLFTVITRGASPNGRKSAHGGSFPAAQRHAEVTAGNAGGDTEQVL